MTITIIMLGGVFGENNMLCFVVHDSSVNSVFTRFAHLFVIICCARSCAVSCWRSSLGVTLARIVTWVLNKIV